MESFIKHYTKETEVINESDEKLVKQYFKGTTLGKYVKSTKVVDEYTLFTLKDDILIYVVEIKKLDKNGLDSLELSNGILKMAFIGK